MKILKCRATLIEELLGTCAANTEIHRTYIATLAPDAPSREEEVAAIGVDTEVERSMTVFPRLNGNPFIWDYQIKGFLKEAARAMNRVKDSEANKTKAFVKILTDCVFVYPRKILLNYDGAQEGVVGSCQRPLRAQTAQGERITLANSETVPAGATFDFEIKLYDEKFEPLVMELLPYAADKGFLQWRNSGKGRAEITVCADA
jgi:hypothetical protein